MIPAQGSGEETPDAKKIVHDLQEVYQDTRQFKAQFSQESTARGRRPLKAKGTFYFKKPGMMRWDYLEPEEQKQEIVSNGKLLWVYQPDFNQVMVYNVEGRKESVASAFLSGMGNLSDDFDVSLEDVEDETYLLNLKPKEEQPDFELILIKVDRKSFIVRETVTFDYLGTKTRISFRDMELNPSLPDGLFNFKTPEGVSEIFQDE